MIGIQLYACAVGTRLRFMRTQPYTNHLHVSGEGNNPQTFLVFILYTYILLLLYFGFCSCDVKTSSQTRLLPFAANTTNPPRFVYSILLKSPTTNTRLKETKFFNFFPPSIQLLYYLSTVYYIKYRCFQRTQNSDVYDSKL